jgi:cytochrome c peroxidase
VPTLRNIALTAPYMHDGSIATLAEVVDHYAAGGRNIVDGPHVGDGRENPNKSPLVRPMPITEQDRADLVAFLESLTDENFVTDPRFAAP